MARSRPALGGLPADGAVIIDRQRDRDRPHPPGEVSPELEENLRGLGYIE